MLALSGFVFAFVSWDYFLSNLGKIRFGFFGGAALLLLAASLEQKDQIREDQDSGPPSPPNSDR